MRCLDDREGRNPDDRCTRVASGLAVARFRICLIDVRQGELHRGQLQPLEEGRFKGGVFLGSPKFGFGGSTAGCHDRGDPRSQQCAAGHGVETVAARLGLAQNHLEIGRDAVRDDDGVGRDTTRCRQLGPDMDPPKVLGIVNA